VNDVYLADQILNIFVVNGIKIIFHTKQFVTHYDSHYCAYVLETDSEETFVFHDNLLLSTPLHMRTSAFISRFVILPHYVH